MTISLNLKPPTCTFSAKESNKFKEHPGSYGGGIQCKQTHLSDHILGKSQLLRGRNKAPSTMFIRFPS